MSARNLVVLVSCLVGWVDYHIRYSTVLLMVLLVVPCRVYFDGAHFIPIREDNRESTQV